MVMRRNSAWHKNNRREIKYTWERYVAIMAIIILGVGFFAGLKVTKTAMVSNLDNYVKEYNMYDFQLLSTLGLTREDVEYFNEYEGIRAEGQVSVDFIADFDVEGEEMGRVFKAHSITDLVNNINLISGRMPEASHEIVLDASVFTEDMIGKMIKVSPENDEDTRKLFSHKEYKVVAIADSVSYLNYDRGTTSLANGSIHGFAYLSEGGFDTDYYTEILIGFEDDLLDNEAYKNQVTVYTDEYKDLVSEYEEILEEALELRANLRYEEIIDEANKELADAKKEYDEGYEEYIRSKADVDSELEEALVKLEDAKKEILDNEEKLNDAKVKIREAEEEYLEGLRSYEDGLKEFEKEKTDVFLTLEDNQKELDSNKEKVVKAMGQIEESGVLIQYEELTKAVLQLEESLLFLNDPSSEEYLTVLASLNMSKEALEEIEATGVTQQYARLQDSLIELELGQRKLDEGKKEASQKFAIAEQELRDAKAKLDSGYREIEDGKKEIEDGMKALEEGKVEYEEGLLEYQDGKGEAGKKFLEAEGELADARTKILDAEKEVEDIPKPKVFVLNRNYNSGYANFDNDSSIVDGIAKVLPIFFFLVAALVCSTTMTRMVDEQRTQIGTLKAIGFSNGAITRRYMFYSGSAALIGCVIGFVLGTKFFPIAIWEAYGMMYEFSPIEYVFDLKLALICFFISLLCSAGVTFVSCKSELLKMPASLIRPKAPKAGKRVLLEKIPFLWRKVSFLHKVSIRNILRYKRRFFMTVIGIAGCTSLIVAALGIRDSIKNVANDQYGTIMTYDYDISFTDVLNKEERETFADSYKEELSECVFVTTDDLEVVYDGHVKKTSVVATDDPNITNVIGLYMDGETIPYPSFNKVVVSNMLARNLDIDMGDYITFRISPTETVSVEVGGVFENYVGNYVFMTGETYQDLFGQEAEYKKAYGKASNEDIYSVSALLLNDDDVLTVNVINDLKVMVDNMMISLDGVIWLVFACAGALGFVVIYNLNNINITERSREIATLKVIGFYSNETSSYVFRETISLTLIGGLVGLVLGKLLHMFIMSQINVEMVSFKEQIYGLSYLIAFIATLALTLLVNWMLRKKIDRIEMADSLKSVE